MLNQTISNHWNTANDDACDKTFNLFTMFDSYYDEQRKKYI